MNREKVIIEKDVSVIMRDGITLKADIYRPETERKLPVLLMRTPYEKEDAQTMNYAHPSYYSSYGYVVIIQDTRGRWESEGEFYPLRYEQQDGYDTVEWAASLPYTNGKVGMYGFSYAGAVQLQAAIAAPPHLVTIIPAMTGSDSFQGRIYENGVFSLALNQSWLLFLGQERGKEDSSVEQDLIYKTIRIQEMYHTLPLQEAFSEHKYPWARFYQDWLDHPTRDEYWLEESVVENYGRIKIPILHIGGLFDAFINGTIENFQLLQQGTASKQQSLILTPWFHMPWSRYIGEWDFGEQANNRIDEWQLRWFHYWLKEDTSVSYKVPAIRYFVTGENTWEKSSKWPPFEVQKQRLYLHSEGRANSLSGDGKLLTTIPNEESTDIFVYNPRIPVPANGGHSAAVPELTPMGPKNQNWVEVRNDILLYTSEPLEQELKVTGEVYVHLYISTDVEDTDFTIKILDVFPDGRAFNISEGIMRVSYRESLTEPSPVKPNEIINLTIKAHTISHKFQKDHLIRLEVSSSMFPTYARHSNTFEVGKVITRSDFKIATQTVYHTFAYPSFIEWDVWTD